MALIDRESEGWNEVESGLDALNYRVHFVETLEELQSLTLKTGCRVVVIDLDIVEISNRFFRSLKKDNADLSILATSSSPFHPQLGEAMTHHICACFRKPIEHEEIEFWLKAVTRRSPTRDPTISLGP